MTTQPRTGNSDAPAQGQHVKLVCPGGWFDGKTGRVLRAWPSRADLWTVQIDGEKIRAAAKVEEMRVIT